MRQRSDRPESTSNCNRFRWIVRIYAHGELSPAGKSVQICLCIITKEEWLFVCSFVALLRVAIFIVDDNDRTSHVRSTAFRVAGNRRYNRPIAGLASSDGIRNRPEKELDKDVNNEAAHLITSLSDGRSSYSAPFSQRLGRLFCCRTLLRRRSDLGVTSTTSSSAMNSMACSRFRAR